MRWTLARFLLLMLCLGIVICLGQSAGAETGLGDIQPAELSAVMKLAAKQAALEKIEISANSTTTIRVLNVCPAKLSAGGQPCYEVTFNQALRPRRNSQDPILTVIVEPNSEKAITVQP